MRIDSDKPASQCPFCGKAFIKKYVPVIAISEYQLTIISEVTRRHAKACAKKVNKPFPEHGKPGRKRHSCANCWRKKVACDAHVPCQRCSKSGLTCSYEVAPGQLAEEEDHVPILRRLTDTLLCDSSIAIAEETLRQSDNSHEAEFGDTLYTMSGALSRNPSPDLILRDNETRRGCLWLSYGRARALEAAMTEAILQTSAVLDMSVQQHHFRVDAALVSTVFTAKNLTDFASVYFDRVHRITPVVHRPTFELGKASVPLLLAIFLAGAKHSAPRDQVIQARQFSRAIEEYVFNHGTSSSFAEENSEPIEILQAAMLVHLLLIHDDDVQTRQRLRNERHPCLLAKMRLFGLPGVAHELREGGESWKSFIDTEVKIRYEFHTHGCSQRRLTGSVGFGLGCIFPTAT